MALFGVRIVGKGDDQITIETIFSYLNVQSI